MSDHDQRPGHSGVFKAIVDGARKWKRAVTGGDAVGEVIDPAARALGEQIARAFVAGRFDAVHATGTPGFQQRIPREAFVALWREEVARRGVLTTFDIASAGPIELGFVPGLEDVPQSQFLGFLQIAFSDPATPLDDERAFTVGVVLVRYEGMPLLGALHKR